MSMLTCMCSDVTVIEPCLCITQSCVCYPVRKQVAISTIQQQASVFAPSFCKAMLIGKLDVAACSSDRIASYCQADRLHWASVSRQIKERAVVDVRSEERCIQCSRQEQQMQKGLTQ